MCFVLLPRRRACGLLYSGTACLCSGTRQESVFLHLPLPLSKDRFYTAPNEQRIRLASLPTYQRKRLLAKIHRPRPAHSSSLSPSGGSHAHTGARSRPPSALQSPPRPLSRRKARVRKSGRRFAFWTRGKGKPPESPTKQGGKGAGGEKSEFNLRSFRRVLPAETNANANANSRLAGSTSYTNLNSSQTNLMGGSTAKLTASNLSSLEMDLGGAPRRPRARGGSDASTSSGSRISVAAFREGHAQGQGQGRTPSPGSVPGMYVGSGAGSQQNLHAQQQQRPQGREGKGSSRRRRRAHRRLRRQRQGSSRGRRADIRVGRRCSGTQRRRRASSDGGHGRGGQRREADAARSDLRHGGPDAREMPRAASSFGSTAQARGWVQV
ncbi:hypothetical protein B0H14DRAFT_1122283 [Mycena olivaceomarginata]|nr:hypothetical protein B0H14DRAFT_1122283 [Mycena olivaceomarginata]